MEGVAASHSNIWPLQKSPPVRIRKSGWAPEPVWTISRMENLAPAGNRTLVVQLVAPPYTDWAIGLRDKI
jgi:hypothetical protein